MRERRSGSTQLGEIRVARRTSDEKELLKRYIKPNRVEEEEERTRIPDTYTESYIQTIENRIRTLETEKQLLQVQRNKLEEERDKLQIELQKLKQPPLLVGILLANLVNGKALVKTSSGTEYTVEIDSSVPENQRLPGSIAFLHPKTFALLEIIPDIQSPPPSGFREQLIEAKDAIEVFLNI